MPTAGLLAVLAPALASTAGTRDAAARYAREPDFPAWKDRLSIYGLDLRHTPSVELLFLHLAPGASPNYPSGIADDTHFQTAGARRMAELVKADLATRNLPLAPFVVP